MTDSSAPRRSTIYTFRDFPHLEAVCRKCDSTTVIQLGALTGGCSHIDVKFCDDGGDA